MSSCVDAVYTTPTLLFDSFFYLAIVPRISRDDGGLFCRSSYVNEHIEPDTILLNRLLGQRAAHLVRKKPLESGLGRTAIKLATYATLFGLN